MEDPPEVYVDTEGRRFMRVKKAEFGTETDTKKDLNEDSSDLRTKEPTSVDLLAEQLRAVMLWRGWEYVAEEPAYDLARKVINNEFPEKPYFPKPSPVEREGRKLIGTTDDRSYVGNQRDQIPYNHVSFWQVDGTANRIGVFTFLSCGHCVYYNYAWWVYTNSCQAAPNNNSTTAVRDPGGNKLCLETLSPQNDGRGTPVDPYGWAGCLRVFIPQAWHDSQDMNFDYSVVDMTYCSTAAVGGAMMIAVADNNYISTRTGGVYGYPAYTGNSLNVWRLNNPVGGSAPFTSGEIWGMTTAAGGVKVQTGSLLYHNMDTSEGQSGSCVWVQDGSAYYCVGIHTGPGSGSWNRATHINNTMFSFIQAHSYDY